MERVFRHRFYTQGQGGPVTVRNVKFVGAWNCKSDGFTVNGLWEDIFLKANDDAIKLGGSSNSIAQRIVVWQMFNGGASP